ncbi:MAG: ABC transporter permease subunit, partial [Firmicutes bacterium]|nr:ABC transporter permease subunit [Candidatus Caballimonas caccae]
IVTSLVVMPILYNNFNNSFNLFDREQLEFCKTENIKESAILFRIEIPEMLPEMLNSIGTGLSLNLKLMVASEVLSQTAKSIGYLLNTSKAYFEISTMIALVLICVIVSVILESIFRFFAKKSASWR